MFAVIFWLGTTGAIVLLLRADTKPIERGRIDIAGGLFDEALPRW
jgi:hypothetical protein